MGIDMEVYKKICEYKSLCKDSVITEDDYLRLKHELFVANKKDLGIENEDDFDRLIKKEQFNDAMRKLESNTAAGYSEAISLLEELGDWGGAAIVAEQCRSDLIDIQGTDVTEQYPKDYSSSYANDIIDRSVSPIRRIASIVCFIAGVLMAIFCALVIYAVAPSIKSFDDSVIAIIILAVFILPTILAFTGWRLLRKKPDESIIEKIRNRCRACFITAGIVVAFFLIRLPNTDTTAVVSLALIALVPGVVFFLIWYKLGKAEVKEKKLTTTGSADSKKSIYNKPLLGLSAVALIFSIALFFYSYHSAQALYRSSGYLLRYLSFKPALAFSIICFFVLAITLFIISRQSKKK